MQIVLKFAEIVSIITVQVIKRDTIMCSSCDDTETESEETETVECSDCGTDSDLSELTGCNLCSSNEYCNECIHNCESCDNSVCDDHTFNCHRCRERNCDDCNRDCTDCSNSLCASCINPCSICDEDVCDGCVWSCDCCGNSVCNGCNSNCIDCNEYYCESCLVGGRCNSCEEDKVSNSVESLEEFSCNPSMLNYDASPHDGWNFIKQPWENTTFLGVELEMEFSDFRLSKMFEISLTHLENKHIWKQDGSLESGGELVITPMTLQAYRNINIKGMLGEFSEAGATSYDNENCGLHVHVNRTAFKPGYDAKLKYFFANNIAALTKFSQRGGKTAYCKFVKACQYGIERHQAINFTNSATVEFRLFRGTLNYERFKASLQFAAAIVDFVNSHSVVACKNDKAWSYFIDYLRANKQYTLLLKHLTKRKLCA